MASRLRSRSRHAVKAHRRPSAVTPDKVFFVALSLQSATQAAIKKVVDSFRAAHGPAAVKGVRWSDLETAHLTLRFIGNAADEKCELLRERLSLSLSVCRPFKMRLTCGGVFYSKRRGDGSDKQDMPQTLYLQGEGCDGALEELRNTANATCAMCGFGWDLKRGPMHVTIGRVRQPPRVPVVELQKVAQGLTQLPLVGDAFLIDVSQALLIASDRNQTDSSGRPTHTVISTIQLTGAGSEQTLTRKPSAIFIE